MILARRKKQYERKREDLGVPPNFFSLQRSQQITIVLPSGSPARSFSPASQVNLRMFIIQLDELYCSGSD